ncbi:Nuclear pore complex protein NUP98A [Camellia lanceoleosa]|uniref:Nuclear pore complex protein NUP98A n=1 Tax=Camellia lanceoleosa TaxID=1840588 RepID=A0ACC0IA30_9ERIC|nr:Nuclear pore complex protein NUP98A [Camellia lanceoleosa]
MYLKTATQSSVALQPAPNVLDKPAAPVRMPSLLTSRHLSQSRIRLPARKYDPKSDGPKVPFFRNDEEMTTTPKTDALFVPRENPRATATSNIEKRSSLVSSLHVHKNGVVGCVAKGSFASTWVVCLQIGYVISLAAGRVDFLVGRGVLSLVNPIGWQGCLQQLGLVLLGWSVMAGEALVCDWGVVVGCCVLQMGLGV